MPYHVRGEKDTGGRVWQPAPYNPGPTTTGDISGVWLNPTEDVEWVWTHATDRSYVSGYILKQKGSPKEIPLE